VRWFNAYRDTEKGADIPKAQFGKYEGGVLWNRQFGLFGRKFSYTASSWGQFGTDVLFSSEKIAVGDLNTVRGFKEDSVSGDRGFYVKNDLAMHDFSFIWKGLGGLKIFAGYDYGLIREKAGREANYGRGRASIMGCAAGISYTSPVIRFMVTYGHRLKAPDFISGDAQAVYVSMSLPLSETYRMIRGSGKPADKTKEE
jgi:hemolysin activation/secretion protein